MVDPKVLAEVELELEHGEYAMARLVYLRATGTVLRAKSSHWVWGLLGKVAPFLLSSWTTWRWPWAAGPTIWFPPSVEVERVLAPGSVEDMAFYPPGLSRDHAQPATLRLEVRPRPPDRRAFDLLRYLHSVDHEIGHVKQIAGAWWRPVHAGLRYFVYPLPIGFSGRWWAERIPYAHELRRRAHQPHIAETVEEVVRSLATNYLLAWPRARMRAWFLAQIALGPQAFLAYLAGPET